MESIINSFISPENAYRGKPFWSWNGCLEPEELIRQIGVMKQMGFGGFFIHSRIGLQDEYLGEKWMEMVNVCIREAKRQDMEVWLYDEDRWPSGFAGGLAVDRPEYATKYIRMEIFDAEEFVWEDHFLAAFCCDLEEPYFSNLLPITRETAFSQIAGKTILAFKIEYQLKASYYNDSPYLDTLNKSATMRFIEVTHEKYKAVFQSEFGRTIKGIFTDEPTRGALLDGFAIRNENAGYLIPWTYDVFDRFQDQFGYSIVEKLPYLFLKAENQGFSKEKWQYIELLQQMFIENFLKPIYAWCNENQLVLTGHLIEESSLYGQTVLCGSIMRCYEHMKVPGIDVLTQKEAYASVVQLASAARQTGKDRKLSELYGITGWEFAFKGHKQSGDWQALMGINFRCHHLSYYTMKGDAKRDCPASILHQSAWWEKYDTLESYFARIGLLMSRGDVRNDLLVINPVESVWGLVYSGFSHWQDCRDEEIRTIDDKYQELIRWLASGKIGFDIGDEEMISRLAGVENDGEGKPVFRLGNAKYKTVLVSGMINIRKSTLDRLEALIDAGGTVVFTEDVPAYVDGVPSRQALRLAAASTTLVREKSVLLHELRKSNTSVSVIGTDQEEIGDILCQLRQDDKYQVLFLLNTSGEKAYQNVTISFPGKGVVQEWDCKNGEQYGYRSEAQGDFISFQADFQPCQERLFLIGEFREDVQERPEDVHKKSLGLAEAAGYHLNEPNVCVLDVAEYRIDHGQWQSPVEVLRLEKRLREEYRLRERGWLTEQPWLLKWKDQKQKPQKTPGTVSLRFPFTIEQMAPIGYELVLEAPEKFLVQINGKPLPLEHTGLVWVDVCFKRFSIPESYLVLGRNQMILTTDIAEDMELEAAYLLGDFALQIQDQEYTLCSLPEKLEFEDITTQGFPFYGSSYVYQLKGLELPASGERYYLSTGSFDAACCEIYNEEGSSVMIAYPPYEADITDLLKQGSKLYLKVYATRQNIFGPLHHTMEVEAYFPDVYLVEGEEFTLKHRIHPCGLKNAPELIVKTRNENKN